MRNSRGLRHEFPLRSAALAGLLVVGTLMAASSATISLSAHPIATQHGSSGLTSSLETSGIPRLLGDSIGPSESGSIPCDGGEASAVQCSGVAPVVAGALPSAPVWTNISTAEGPSARVWASIAYDAAAGYAVLFGGMDRLGYSLDDTWTFSDGVWRNITDSAGTPPSARSEMSMTYDSAGQYILAFGGTNNTGPCGSSRSCGQCGNGYPDCNDTWMFDSGRWSLLPTRGSDSPGSAGDLVYDAAANETILTDGVHTWQLSAGVWSELCENGSPNDSGCGAYFHSGGSGVATYDAYTGSVLFLGGRGGRQTWEFSGGSWTNLTSLTGAPPPAGEWVLTYDAGTQRVLAFGGPTNVFGADENQTWSYSNGTWSNLTLPLAPTPRYGASFVYDADDSVAALFGGAYTDSSGNVWTLQNTWVWGTNPPMTVPSITVSPAVPGPDEPVTLTSSFRGGVAPFSYLWEFGNGNSSTRASPTQIFLAGGHYTVRLWVNDSGGRSVNASVSVWVYAPLTITSLAASPNPATLGQQVTFTSTVTAGTPPYTYAWSFGDGETGGNLSTIVHAYTTDGPFTVGLTVTDAIGGRAEASLNVSIGLAALASSTRYVGDAPLAVSFTGAAQGGYPPYTYSWNFGDGSPVSTAQDPLHTYAVPGMYTVTLTILDSRGDRTTSSLTILAEGTIGARGPPAWVLPVVGALSIGLAAVAAAWTVDWYRRRSNRREGERWVDELTQGPVEPVDVTEPPR